MVAVVLCGGLSAGCGTLESTKRQKGHGDAVAFDAPYAWVFAAALQTVHDLQLTVLGHSQPDGYIWAQQRPAPLRSWEWIVPTPRALKRGLQQAATPGQHVAVYLYPVNQERVIDEVIDQRISPVGMDRLLGTDIFAGITRRLSAEAGAAPQGGLIDTPPPSSP